MSLPSPSNLPGTAKQRAADARCAAMIAHARALIAERGIAHFSVNEVLRLAGGSKATLAKYFGDRSGLLSVAIAEEAREAMAPLALAHHELADAPLREALRLLLTGVLRFYMQPGALALYRAVVAVGAQDRTLAAALYDHGHRQVVDTLAALLKARGQGPACDPQRLRDLAEQMVHAIRAGLHERALLGLDMPPVAEADIAARIERTLDLVLPGLEAELHA